jgi:hypothetical protein
MGRTFTYEGRLVRSDDGVVVDLNYNHELASYEFNGEKWFVPWEYWTYPDGTVVQGLYINRGAVYKEGAEFKNGAFDVQAGEALLTQMREDMQAAFSAAGLKAVLHQFRL